MPRPSTVLFDLDGTLADSAASIIGALRGALAANGLPRLDPSIERTLLGPPMYDSLPPLIGAAAVPGVIASYRELYPAAMADTAVYPGIVDLLEGLRAAGLRLAVATSKLESVAESVVEQLGLRGYFTVVGGDDPAGLRRTKALVIESVLQRLGDPQANDVIMVGDRSLDVDGARAHGIDTIAALWGYALPGELDAAKPAHRCATPADVAAVVLGD